MREHMEGSRFLLFFITLLPLESNFSILAALFLLTFPQNVKQQERAAESNSDQYQMEQHFIQNQS